jgi:hypothetical protein
MNELNEFLTLVSQAKKEAEEVWDTTPEIFSDALVEKTKFKTPKIDISSKLKETSFLSLLESEMVKSKEIEKEQKVKEDIFASFFESIPVELNRSIETVITVSVQLDNEHSLEKETIEEQPIGSEEIQEEIISQPVPEVIVEAPKKMDLTDPSHYDKLFKTNTDHFSQPDAPKVDPTVKALTDKVKYMEDWLSKISMAGPGSGEVNLRYLDDIDRPSIYDGRYLRYNDSIKKFEFAEVNPHDIIYTTTLVTTPTYSVDNDDYYVGVNYAGPVTITLPLTPSSGRMLIIKDESSNAETNPISVLGNVDNDAGGFIIQINNGAIQMIYRNGWRIV